MFEFILDPILGPLLNLDPLWTIVILAAGITLVITLTQKFATNQDEMRELKKQQKHFQKEMKKAQKTKDPDKIMKIQKKNMAVSMKYMKHSMKATLYTFIPIIIIFGWMQGHLGYDPIEPNEVFKVSVLMQEGLPGEVTLSAVPELNIDQPTKLAAGTISWDASGTKGEYKLFVTYGENQYEHDLIITTEHLYKSPTKKVKAAIQSITVEMAPIRPFGNFSILGWRPGWLGAYILLSIVFSLGARKIFNVS